jgi:hypothetical protein
VAVDVEGDGDAGVPEPLLDHLRMDPRLEEQGGMGMRDRVMAWRLLRGLGLLSESVQMAGRVAVEERSLPSDLDFGRLVPTEDLPALLAASRAVAAGLRGEVPDLPDEPEVAAVEVDDGDPDMSEEPEEDALQRALAVYRR